MTSGTSRYREMRHNFVSGLHKAVECGSSWETFLEFYGRHTNLPFTSAICAWRERPDAGEIRAFSEWSRDRWKIRKGERGVLGQDEAGPGRHLYLFDESQVEHGTDKGGAPLEEPVPRRDWSIVEKHANAIAAMTATSPGAYEVTGIAPALPLLGDMADRRARAVLARHGCASTDAVLGFAYKSALYALLVRAGEAPMFDISDADVSRMVEESGGPAAVGKCMTVMVDWCAEALWQIADYLETTYGNWAEAACAHLLVPSSQGKAADWMIQPDGRTVEVVASESRIKATVLGPGMLPERRCEIDLTRPEVRDGQVRALGFDPEDFVWQGGAHKQTMMEMIDGSLRSAAGGDMGKPSIVEAVGEIETQRLERCDAVRAIASGMLHYCAGEISLQVEAARASWGLDVGYGCKVVEATMEELCERALGTHASDVSNRKNGQTRGRKVEAAAPVPGGREPGHVPDAVLRNDRRALDALGRPPNRVRYEHEGEPRERECLREDPAKDQAEARAAAEASAKGKQALKTRRTTRN